MEIHMKTPSQLDSEAADVLKKAEARRARVGASKQAPKAKPATVKAADEVKLTPSLDGTEMKDVKDPAAELGKPLPSPQPQTMAMPDGLEKEVEKALEPIPDAEYPGIEMPEGVKDITARLVNLTELTAAGNSVQIDMHPFVAAGASTPSDSVKSARWVVMANGTPLAAIHLADQDQPERIAAHFMSEDYANQIYSYLEKNGLENTLNATRARFYEAVVNASAKAKEIKATLTASANETLKQKAAAVKATFLDRLDLVLEADRNGHNAGDNTLKAALVAGCESMGLAPQLAAEMVDQAFFMHGKTTVSAFLNKAEQWSTMDPVAFSEFKNTVLSAARRPVTVLSGFAAQNPGYSVATAQRFASAVVPSFPTDVPTATVSASAAPGSADDKIRAGFGRVRR
jgi:hypothetical protein